MAAPLEGFSFLEVGDSPSASYAGHLLALLGADVIKVAAPAVQEVSGPRPPLGGLDTGKIPLVGSVSAEQLARAPVAGAVHVRWAAEEDGGRDQVRSTEEDGVPDRARSTEEYGVRDRVRSVERALASAPYPVVAAAPDRRREIDWARSGAMALTGEAEGPPLVAPGLQAACMRGASLAAELLGTLAGGKPDRLDGPALLGERAAVAGLRRRGRVSPGGGARLLEASDGWLAVSLARPADLDLVAAWLEIDWEARWVGDPWSAAQSVLIGWRSGAAVERAQLLGIPACEARPPTAAFCDPQAEARGQRFPPSPFVVDGCALRANGADPLRDFGSLPRSSRSCSPPWLVVDLSSLWAGPLAASLVADAGVRVVKVESPNRPDGARSGWPEFFDILNWRKESVSFDLSTGDGASLLRGLIDAADLVVDSSRPRAMDGLGLSPGRRIRRSGEAASWLSITGYGRSGPWRERVAFGDDAAVAGGASAGLGDAGPLFCADAYADPATGVHAAVAALAQLVGGGGRLIELSLREVVGHMLWDAECLGGGPAPFATVEAPRARRTPRHAPSLGYHTAAVSWELGLDCRGPWPAG